MAVAVVAAAVPPAVASATAPPSFLDPAFGTNGVVTLDMSSGPSWANAIAHQSDGELVVAGTTEVDSPNNGVVVARFLTSGQLDPTFGTAGVFTLPGGSVECLAAGVVIQPNGKIVVADGLFEQGVEGHVELFRLDQDGTFDTTFGQSGFAQTPPGLNVDVNRADLLVQPDGKLVVGNDFHPPATHQDAVLMAARFTADGIPDSGFGAQGVATADVSSDVPLDDLGTSAALLPDGRILVGGETGAAYPSHPTESSLAVFTPTGALDPTFGNAGTLILGYPTAVKPNSEVTAVAAQPDGTIVVVSHAADDLSRGDSGDQLVVARLTGSGAFDPTFGTGGMTIVGNAEGDAVAIDSVGHIVVSGRKFGGPAGALLTVRLDKNGALDPSFGGGGVVTPVDDPTALLLGVTVQPLDGHPVAVGEVDNKFTVLRYRVQTSAAGFGWNPVGELGIGTTTDTHSPVLADGLTGSTSLAAGAYHGLAVKGDGSLWSFGWNGLGQLGDGTTTQRPSPVPVALPTGAVTAAAGVYHSLALGVDGHVYAFGWNGVGQLGGGTTTDEHSPVAVAGLSNVVGIAAGAYHSLAVKADGTVWAWGWNILGQLGDGATTDRHSPVQVVGLTNVVAVAAGAYSSLALKSDGTVWFWGWNGAGQAGDGTTVNHLTPVQVPGLTGVTAIASGYYHSLALKSDGTVRAWGWNASGELGDGSTALRLSPVSVSGLTGATVIAGGAFHSLAARSDGTAVAWGWNGVGQLGTGGTTDHPLPVVIPGLTAVTAVSAGLAQSLVSGGT